MSRIEGLTPLRGLAALWVALFHADVILFFRQFGALLDRDRTGLLSQGYLWVDFFFLLSGFIIAHVYGAKLAGPFSPETAWRYLAARFARVYPLHLVTLLLLIPLRVMASMWFPAMRDGSWDSFLAWRAIPSNLLMTHAMNQHVYLSWNIVSWSIGAEWWTYVAALLLVWPIQRRAALLALIAGALLAGLVWLMPARTLDITFDYGFFRCLFEFTLGLALHQAYKAGWGPRGDLPLAALLIAIALSLHAKAADLVLVPLFALLILAAAFNQGRLGRLLATKPLQHLGEISYALYMTHGVWFMIFWYGLPELRREGLWAPVGWGFALLFLGLSLVSAHLAHTLFEKRARTWLFERLTYARLRA
jgi:peptidoglycan/LPS O-acetylase OafA/YrhL